jgi:hypothetical protein
MSGDMHTGQISPGAGELSPIPGGVPEQVGQATPPSASPIHGQIPPGKKVASVAARTGSAVAPPLGAAAHTAQATEEGGGPMEAPPPLILTRAEVQWKLLLPLYLLRSKRRPYSKAQLT